MDFVRRLLAVLTLTVVAATAEGQPTHCPDRELGSLDGSSCVPSKLAQVPAWTLTGSLNVPRAYHTATLLDDGKVLVTGGWGAQGPLDTVELYDPATGVWTIAGHLKFTRYWHTATLLNDGRVLVVGGNVGDALNTSWHCGNEPYVRDELFDPSTGESTQLSSTIIHWQGHVESHTATLLESGRVLVAGGTGCLWFEEWGGDMRMNLLYDLPPGPPRQLVGFTGGRAYHQATLLRDGRVLVTGGIRWDAGLWPALSVAETFDPGSEQWSAAGNMAVARENHTAILLTDGTVLVVGGGSALAERFDPVTSTWHNAGTIGEVPPYRQTASLLPNGLVLIVGGHPANTNKVFSTSGEWFPAPDLNIVRPGYHTATVLHDGRVLVVGGFAAGSVTGAAELLKYERMIAVAKQGSGSGNVKSNIGAIDCGAKCSDIFAAPTVVTLTASADAGSVFTGWLGRCTGNAATCVVSVDAAASVSATFAPSTIGNTILDADADAHYDALTDALIVIRHLFGMSGPSLVNDVLSIGATRTDPAVMQTYLNDVMPKLDIDGNGQADALTDGLLILRYLFGLRNAALTDNAIGPGAIRTTPGAIEAQILTLMP